MDVALTGDSAETLRELLRLLDAKRDRAWLDHIEQIVRESRAEEDRKALAPALPLNPQLRLCELSTRLPADCIVTSDSSSVVVWVARHLQLRRGMMMSVSGGLATIGSALPYELAAKFA